MQRCIVVSWSQSSCYMCCTVLWLVAVVTPCLVLQLQLSHYIWCYGHCRCAAFGVAVAIVAPHVVSWLWWVSSSRVVSQVLSLCHIWCCSCHHCTMHGLTCTVVVPCLCCSFHHRAVHSVTGTVIVPHLVLWLLSSHHMWCYGRSGCC